MCSRTPRGFTLIELLVVVVLIGIIGAMVTISLGHRGNRATENEAGMLAAAANYADDAAVLSGQPRGLVLARDGYQLVQFDGQQWQPERTGNTTHHALAAPMEIDADSLWPRLGDPAHPQTPQLLFLPSGEHQVPAFALINKVTAEHFAINQDEDGRFFAGEVQ
jgi:type II secretion system protein H